MLRNKVYFSVPGETGPQGPPGTPGTIISVPNPSTLNAIAAWGDTTGTTLSDTTFTLTNPFSIKDAETNNLISIDSSLITLGSGQTKILIPNIMYYDYSTGNLQIGGSSNLPVNINGSNVACGRLALSSLNTNVSSNCAYGNQAMEHSTSSYHNCAFGESSLRFCSGISNCAYGYYSAANYIGAESNNICLGHFCRGEASENDTIRLGFDQTRCFVAGIYNNMDSTGDHQPVYVDSDGKLHTSYYTIPVGEVYTENPSLYTTTLPLNTATQLIYFTGFNSNIYFNSPDHAELQYTGPYTRLIQVTLTISGIIASGLNQLLVFEIRVNGVKSSAASVRVLFKDNTDYQIVHIQKLISLDHNDIITVWCTNTSGSNDLSIYNFNLSAVSSN